MCVADSNHSKLKFLIFDPVNLNIRNSFILPNPIHSTLKENSRLRRNGHVWIDADESNIRIQYYCALYYHILDISINDKNLTSSYSFHARVRVQPNIKSLRTGVIVIDDNGQLIFGETRNKLKHEVLHLANNTHGPIEHMYQECIKTGKRARSFCEQLSENLYDGSLFEFYCAHRLLMMAIQDGEIEKSPHHNGEQFKWHKLIYSQSESMQLQKAEETKELKRILIEAIEFNVIESVTHYLSANEKNQTISFIGKQLFMRLAQVEATSVNLELVFQRYRRLKGMTELMGVAFNVIPFLDGSTATAISAGAKLAEGFQISDVESESLQVLVDTISRSPTFEQGILKCVAIALRKEEIKERAELVQSLERCGESMEELQKVLDSGIIGNDYQGNQHYEDSNCLYNAKGNTGQISTGAPGERSDETTAEDLLLGVRISSTDNNNPENEIPFKGDDSKHELNFSNLEGWKMSEFRKLSEDKAMVRLLSIRQCSFFVAALILLFDDDLEDEFRKLQPLVYGINVSRMISGKVLCDYNEYSGEVNGALNDLKKIYPVNTIMRKEFLRFAEKQMK